VTVRFESPRRDDPAAANGEAAKGYSAVGECRLSAIWWAVTTMTTGGCGDHYPVTAAGRLVAFGLMLGGIALLGTVTATLASWIVEGSRCRERANRGPPGHYPTTKGQNRPTRRREQALSIMIKIRPNRLMLSWRSSMIMMR